MRSPASGPFGETAAPWQSSALSVTCEGADRLTRSYSALPVRMTDVSYNLPDEAIAQTPVEPRDAARLLVDGPNGAQHRHVHDLPDLLREGDLLVVNDTKVLPARLFGQRATGGRVELVLLESLSTDLRSWEALVRPSAKVREGEAVAVGDTTIVVRERLGDGGTRAVTINADDPIATLQRLGEMPLPPYITSRDAPDDRYQTIYADRPASAAAPTAGLHFTAELFERLAGRGVEVAKVELVVGLDTFRPVAVEDPADHPMHSESYRVSADTWAACSAARAEGRRVVAVGTTTVRALESAAATGELSGRTRLFIRRPYPWQVVDVMMTNFHLPRTTLLLMIDAFIGPRWRELYETALAEGYRFLSFGDAMLLERDRTLS
jgi:S-adenosylmethionine:tRNA ribosyltransferase-isomerase